LPIGISKELARLWRVVGAAVVREVMLHRRNRRLGQHDPRVSRLSVLSDVCINKRWPKDDVLIHVELTDGDATAHEESGGSHFQLKQCQLFKDVPKLRLCIVEYWIPNDESVKTLTA